MSRDPIDDAARALFAAGARDQAPARLRAALLARSASELRSGVAERVLRLPEMPSRQASAPRPRFARQLWPVLSAAAVLVAAVTTWSVRGPSPGDGVLISAERAPAAGARPAPERPPAEAVLPDRVLPEAVLPEAVLPEALPPAVPERAAGERSESRELSAPPAAPRQRSRAHPANPAPSHGGPVEREQAAPELAAPTRPPPSAAAPRAAPDITRQLALLQQVQRALRAGENQRALELLDQHAAELDQSDFDAEARLMRIEALAGAGQPAEAGRRAREFLIRFPHSPLVDRARRFTEGAAPGAP